MSGINKILGILLICYSLVSIAEIALHRDACQWDLYRYYACAKAYEAGVNPYDSSAVSQMAHRRVISFTNPPIVLFIFRPFAKVDYSLLFNVYLILKCVLLTGLIYIWRNVFLNKQAGLMFYVLCVFGFNAAIYLDLRAGNINMFEQCLLWLAFFYYLKHKLIRFCVLLITASIFKLQPMLFIFLLLFAQDKNKYKLLLLSLAVFIAILLMQYLYDPRLFSHFIAGFVAFSGLERGIINPSTSALLRDLVDLLLKIKDRNLLNVVSTIAYGIAIIPIIVISLLALARLKSADIKDKEKWAVLFSCSLYAVVANYFKDWSYILLIVPAYFIIKTTRISPKGLLLFIACLCVINVHLPGAAAVNNLFWNYYPLFVAYLVWYLYLNELRTTS